MDRPKFKTSSNMKMVGLMLLLTTTLWNTQKAFRMVLKELFKIRNRSSYGSTQTKKTLYWPRFFCKNGIDA